MITLQRVGDVVKFTFQDNPLYLNNGTIEVPVNSLSLLIDESDIATFKKNNGDAFLSCPLTELGMTKEQLIQWYKDNAVDEGMTPEEVEDIVESATINLFGYAEYDSQNTRINFKHNSTGSVISSIDASDFVIDGMIDNVEIVTVQGIKYLKITFNTDSGKEPILIPLSDIFNPNEYYTKTEVDAALSEKVDTDAFDEKERVIAASLTDLDERKLDASAYTPTDLSNYYTKSETDDEIEEAVSGKADTSAVTEAITEAVSGKQDTLISGTNIKTINNESILGSGNIDIQGGGKAIEAGRGISITTGETADTINCTLNINNGRGDLSIVEGYLTEATANYSHAEGGASKANGYCSHAEGDMTSAATEASHAEGRGTKTSNTSEHASGQYNVSSKAATTFGDSGNTLFSVGNGTANNARHNAFEIRQNGDIYITKDGQDVKLQDQLGGGGNVDLSLDTSSTNAVSNSAVSTALNHDDMFLYRVDPVMTWDNHPTGKLQLRWRNPYNGITNTTQDSITLVKINNIPLIEDYVSGISNLNLVETSAITTSMSSSSTDSQVPSAKAVYDNFGGLKLVKLTQAEYDAIVTKDSNTLYVVTDN